MPTFTAQSVRAKVRSFTTAAQVANLSPNGRGTSQGCRLRPSSLLDTNPPVSPLIRKSLYICVSAPATMALILSLTTQHSTGTKFGLEGRNIFILLFPNSIKVEFSKKKNSPVFFT
jgi:hypothetical protein